MSFQLYADDFSSGAGGGITHGGLAPSWSTSTTDVAPSGRYGTFLGQFGNESVDLRIEGLPPQSRVDLMVKFFAINSWDGDNDEWGPDIWKVEEVTNGLLLLESTFSNEDNDPAWNQSYHKTQAPLNSVNSKLFTARTDSIEQNTLGYVFNGVPADSIYRIDLSFLHSGEYLVLRFTGQNLQDITDESWGLDDIVVYVS
jgi:hypothetical protein